MGFPDGTWQAIVGGTLLGTTATVMLATTGKLIGLSGIFDGALSRQKGQGWKVIFLCGFTVGGITAGILYPEGLDQTGSPPVSTLGFIVSGFLVGLGTRLGNGCTSGHGLCGLPRLSRRSLVATLTFLTSGRATACMMAAWAGEGGVTSVPQESPMLPVRYIALAAAAVGTVFTMAKREERKSWKSHLASMVCGASFAGGLVLSGMVKRAKVVDFLAARRDTFDPSLMFVLGCGVVTCLLGFPFVTRKLGAPLCRRTPVPAEDGADSSDAAPPTIGDKFEIPTNTELDMPLVLGSWVFGVGWGSAGMCPGPAFVAATFGLPGPALAFLPAVVVGMKVAVPLKASVSLPPPTWIMGERRTASGDKTK